MCVRSVHVCFTLKLTSTDQVIMADTLQIIKRLLFWPWHSIFLRNSCVLFGHTDPKVH